MTEMTGIAGRVIETLVDLGRVTADQVASIRETAGSDAETGHQLLARGLVTSAQLSALLEDEMGFPRVDLTSYAPDEDAVAVVPAEIARRYGILPLFEIEGTLTVAIGDAADIFVLDSAGGELGFAMDAVLGDLTSVRDAITLHYGEQIAAPELPVAPTPEATVPEPRDFVSAMQIAEDECEQPEDAENIAQTVEEVVAADVAAGPAPVDLDVLAVADERRVAVLVSEILEQAVARGASRIHLLPYKSDFFLVFRIKGRLEKIASAPLSMQQQLIDGFKSYGKLGSVAPNRPALGRVHAEIAGKQLVLTVSSVPTVAGQRLVISIAPARPNPRDLSALGMSDAESRALYAMVERGRGLLLVAAPVTGGRSTTYYALLQHAAQVGKTVYSVERSIEYEIPAVAQVLVSPGQPIGASSYFAAGMRQDTDVLALDSIQSVEDIHLAIEAAGLGKLVIVTFAGADIVSAVRRLLDLGAEPVSLASALTLGVGQRVVRTNCPQCAAASTSPLTDRIPGANGSMPIKRGTGCSACGKTGFAGAAGIFEVLPFTEPVRAAIARGGSHEQIAAAASAAGMRPMISSGLSKVAEGTVSPEELDRVLRFAQ
ncbi:MAG TPA: ATPase, T2SS/T4P/T4SS family [Coriobacteriia bacterium]|nr:ATPase, T2SS/T4P/T4SS family [Coriobacteriia bacterium]